MKVHGMFSLILHVFCCLQCFSSHNIELFSVNDGDMEKSSWGDFRIGSNLEVLNDDSLYSLDQIVPIDRVHHEGLLHRGIWIALTRAAVGGVGASHREVLLIKRTLDMKTCPGSWGFIGEHSNPGESWIETATRALTEEVNLTGHVPVDLLHGRSLLVQTQYLTSNRRELQATKLYHLHLSIDESKGVEGDSEVADMQWLTMSNVSSMLSNSGSSSLLFCTAELASLAVAMVDKVSSKKRRPQHRKPVPR